VSDAPIINHGEQTTLTGQREGRMDEEIKIKTKQWQKPQLIALARSKPEDSVLAYCKYSSKSGAHNYASSCQTWLVACYGSCSVNSLS
jgi:hypothetical protein